MKRDKQSLRRNLYHKFILGYRNLKKLNLEWIKFEMKSNKKCWISIFWLVFELSGSYQGNVNHFNQTKKSNSSLFGEKKLVRGGDGLT